VKPANKTERSVAELVGEGLDKGMPNRQSTVPDAEPDEL